MERDRRRVGARRVAGGIVRRRDGALQPHADPCTNRRPADALGLVPGIAVLPHYETFGHRWVESARRELPGATLLGIDERSAAVWVGGGWRAAGPGAVTMIEGANAARFTTGMQVTGLPIPARMLPSQ